MLVFAFDRDWTVDVNPHPQYEAVPLEWVRYLAHKTDHAVYAIGNQDLAEEAAIPGVVDIVGRHPADWDDWLGDKQPDGRYESFPTRRERLTLIEALHPAADRYIVVDDLDLSDVEGWQHYHAWEFVPAVRDGHLDLAPPLTDDQVSDDDLATDGGLPTVAGIKPADADHLASFLDGYDDTPGFEITYEQDGDDVTRLCWDVTVVEDTAESEAPIVRCSSLIPKGESFTVPIGAIDVVHVVKLSPEAVTAQAETQPDAAAALRRLADAAPNQLQLSPVLTLLDQKALPPQQQRDALHALAALTTVRPDACSPAIPILRSLLQEDDPVAPHDALTTLHAIAEASPEDIAPALDDIEPYLDSERTPVQREAAGCLAGIATEYPADCIDAVPKLVDFLEEDDERRRYAVRALAKVAAESPETTASTAGHLAEIALEESASNEVRQLATAALGRTLRAPAAFTTEIFEDVVELYDTDNYKLRNNAIALTYEVADLHTDIVEEYIDDIAALLTDDDSQTRINASGTLARVAEDFPASVSHLTPMFVELLSDDNEQVRENACWALGRLEASEAKATLEERLQEEPSEAVRNRIAWALSEIDPV
ncbi:HEAT repeat domain-containing protein [Halapricum desulfuricans]|uniref:HEAT repeats containing protein n=1 Tax=Halapricum desulfuricans TaxID=2841257 RepID=A0A897P248_9EURY|nr:HEAT repeat domain-containing protein [Halapricum desulfuricans]QSG16306.1 HEAT repeats containing protein [Halapricum desulfuricans]